MELTFWVYDLINAVSEYEEQHDGKVGDLWCFQAQLLQVPQEERDRARTIAGYLRDVNEVRENG